LIASILIESTTVVNAPIQQASSVPLQRSIVSRV
jgi:hypothetical protein